MEWGRVRHRLGCPDLVFYSGNQRLSFRAGATSGSKPPLSGQHLEAFQGGILAFPFFSSRKISCGARCDAADEPWQVQSCLGLSPLHSPPRCHRRLSHLLISPLNTGPAAAAPLTAGRWMGPSWRRGAWDMRGDAMDAGGLGKRSLPAVHPSPKASHAAPPLATLQHTGAREFPRWEGI